MTHQPNCPAGKVHDYAGPTGECTCHADNKEKKCCGKPEHVVRKGLYVCANCGQRLDAAGYPIYRPTAPDTTFHSGVVTVASGLDFEEEKQIEANFFEKHPKEPSLKFEEAEVGEKKGENWRKGYQQGFEAGKQAMREELREKVASLKAGSDFNPNSQLGDEDIRRGWNRALDNISDFLKDTGSSNK